MKKASLMLAMVLGFLVSGCAVQRHCFIYPPLNREYTVTAGSDLVVKKECYGRVTVNECKGSGLIYLGKIGGNIRIQGKIGTVTNITTIRTGVVEALTVPQNSVWKTPIITEILYPGNSKLIEFQDAKIEVIEASDNQITFKLISISTEGCNKVNGEVK